MLIPEIQNHIEHNIIVKSTYNEDKYPEKLSLYCVDCNETIYEEYYDLHEYVFETLEPKKEAEKMIQNLDVNLINGYNSQSDTKVNCHQITVKSLDDVYKIYNKLQESNLDFKFICQKYILWSNDEDEGIMNDESDWISASNDGIEIKEI